MALIITLLYILLSNKSSQPKPIQLETSRFLPKLSRSHQDASISNLFTKITLLEFKSRKGFLNLEGYRYGALLIKQKKVSKKFQGKALNQTMAGKPEEKQHVQPPSSTPPIAEQKPDEEAKKWGTHIMGPPAVPSAHPDNQKAASWKASEHQQIYQQQPYVLHAPVDKPTNNPLEPVINMFDTWSQKAESLARDIWHNLKTGPSVTEAAWGKVNLTAKAITEGGFESLFRQTFETDPNEKLKRTFACYLSTTTGPVAGTLYLSTARVAFCSDRPLSFTAPSGQQAWSYYKVNIPLANIETLNPEIMKENPSDKYIQIVTVDRHEFWFMGFVNFEKASHHLLESVSNFSAQGRAAQPVVG